MQADILRSWLLERRVYPIQYREVHQMNDNYDCIKLLASDY